VRESVREQILAVELMDRTYFGKDRPKLLKAKIDEILAMLDTKPIEFVQNKKEKADLLYLRGKTLDFLPEYSKGAEDFLSKSIKLLPSKFEAWDALGHTYWKKRDLAGAKKCFEGSLEQNADNKDALRHLSMVLRMLDEPNADLKKKNFSDSIQLANKAVSLDLSDAHSWYVLGNAHLTNFFANNDSVSELTSALKAYT
jgi:tetratricopeptide (TPR) repeat protein